MSKPFDRDRSETRPSPRTNKAGSDRAARRICRSPHLQTGHRYVGVLTDGTEWDCYNLVEGRLQQVSTISCGTTADDLNHLIVWLEGVLATAQGIPPTAQNIENRLGATSSAYALDRASLSALYERNKMNPSVQMKRTLWSRLLTSALGTQFEDDEFRFIEHTLLVNSAEIIAHAVLGLRLGDS